MEIKNKVDLSLNREDFYKKYKKNKTASIYTLGCKVNQYESNAIANLLENEGYEIVDFESEADVYIINTCTVTGISARKSRQMIRKAVTLKRKQNGEAVIVAAGCYPQTAPQEISAIKDVDIITGTKDKNKIIDYIKNYSKCNKKQINEVDDITKAKNFEELHVDNYKDRTRAYVKIQDGCNQYCSYCIIPYARGPIRSRRPEDVISEAKKLADNGFLEIELIGIHLASYGKDLGYSSLVDIVRRVHEIDGIKRIRLSSLEPSIITPEFIDKIKGLNKLCPHYHISLQSGCDDTLKRMNRKYTTLDYKAAVQLLRKSIDDVSITTDVMVGFPGETDLEFEQTYKFAEEIGFSKMHVFKFSPRKGTPAYLNESQVPAEIKEERSKRLIRLSEECALKFNKSFEGRVFPVLFEQPSDYPGFYEGLTPNYIRVLYREERDLKGQILNVVIKEAHKDFAIAETAGPIKDSLTTKR